MYFISCSKAKHLLPYFTKVDDRIIPIPLEHHLFPGHEFSVSCPAFDTSYQEVFILQNFTNNVNDDLMELMLSIDTIKRYTNIQAISIIAPYLAYTRQDRLDDPRSSLALKVLAKMLQIFSPKQLLTIDLHNIATTGFFDFPVKNISTANLFAQDILQEYDLANTVLVSPDFGSLYRTKQIAKILEVDYVLVHKHRTKQNIEVTLAEDVTDKQCIIIDDVIATGKTMGMASQLLVDKGARSVSVYASHLLEFALNISSLANINRLHTTNSLAAKFASRPSKVLDISQLIISNLV